MSVTCKRRGQTWQSGDWRRRVPGDDLGERARIAFARVRGLRTDASETPQADQHRCARMQAPFTGDDTPAEKPFIIRPEYRSFA
jgi:hypothetical protein